jgi:hypothetical protein
MLSFAALMMLIYYALVSYISIIELLKAGLSQKSLLVNPSPLIFVTALYLVLAENSIHHNMEYYFK